MTAQSRIEKPETTASLDRALHDTLSGITPAGVAAMQILVHDMQAGGDTPGRQPVDAFLTAAAQVQTALDDLKTLQGKQLETIGIAMPDDLRKRAEALTQALAELAQIAGRCTVADDGSLKGYRGCGNMYDLCCTRVAQGVGDFCAALSQLFVDLGDRDKSDAQDKTSAIAQEIGKIGRVINMVATNASIEAARVGDAGKGFTVIADEVKVLSSRVSSLSVSLTDRLR